MRQIIITLCLWMAMGEWAEAQSPAWTLEKLDRGLIALPATTGNYVSWRFLATDDEATTSFELLRNGERLANDCYATNFTDPTGKRTDKYQVVTIRDGIRTDTTQAVAPWANPYLRLTLQRPAKGENGGNYEPNDCSVGDVDGDGQYEIFVKWNPSNAKDNSQGGVTDNVYIDCYRLSGERLWRIDLGRNIRAGAHYTQYMVYDFDGDGRAEMMCKTGPGSKDGKNGYVNQAATDPEIKSVPGTALYRSNDGRITGGQEWLTVFDGLTGEALHTIFYNPNRDTTYGGEANGSFNWDDRSGKSDYASYGNRGERFLAAVAHLDGPNQPASGIFSRGYYTFAFIWAVDFDGHYLHQKWLSSHRSRNSYTLTTYSADGSATSQTFTGCQPTSGGGSGTMYGNGNHNMSVADVNGDGRDEVVWGAAALASDGHLLYGTGFGHGDALHLSDLNPTRPGLEMFQVHEEKGTYAWDIHDAATGEVLLKGGPAGIDNGRGIAGFFSDNVPGAIFWSGDKNARSAISGEAISDKIGSNNFRIYWDGDLQEELLDGNKIDKWSTSGTTRIVTFSDLGPSNTCNGSKNTPCLSADILGDWREEVILHNGSDQLAIYSTNIPTNYRVPTLMHDHTYRMGICWQNTAYNQPPHLGYYLVNPDLPTVSGADRTASTKTGEQVELTFPTANTVEIEQKGYSLDGIQHEGLPEGLTFSIAPDASSFTLAGTFQQAGAYSFHFTLTGRKGTKIPVTVNIVVRSNEVVSGKAVRWDFTRWSAETVANLRADAAASKTEGWSDVEKQADADAGNEPTSIARDNCFWASKNTQPDEHGELSANGQVIDELRGLRFHQPALANRNLAIAVNYPATDIGTYHGPAYLWLGGANKDYFTIPRVVEGSEIKMGVESHKSSDARGVQLFVNNGMAGSVVHGVQLSAPDGSSVALPTAYTELTWYVVETADVTVYNTNGCHIYFIEATVADDGTAVGSVVGSRTCSQQLFDLQGRRVTRPAKGLYVKDGKKTVIK
jgi:rhamnogalacturonan endolyase